MALVLEIVTPLGGLAGGLLAVVVAGSFADGLLAVVMLVTPGQISCPGRCGRTTFPRRKALVQSPLQDRSRRRGEGPGTPVGGAVVATARDSTEESDPGAPRSSGRRTSPTWRSSWRSGHGAVGSSRTPPAPWHYPSGCRTSSTHPAPPATSSSPTTSQRRPGCRPTLTRSSAGSSGDAGCRAEECHRPALRPAWASATRATSTGSSAYRRRTTHGPYSRAEPLTRSSHENVFDRGAGRPQRGSRDRTRA